MNYLVPYAMVFRAFSVRDKFKKRLVETFSDQSDEKESETPVHPMRKVSLSQVEEIRKLVSEENKGSSWMTRGLAFAVITPLIVLFFLLGSVAAAVKSYRYNTLLGYTTGTKVAFSAFSFLMSYWYFVRYFSVNIDNIRLLEMIKSISPPNQSTGDSDVSG